MFSITIDGKAGCGKSTLAEELSKKLNIKKFNTGAVYRGITCEYFKQFNKTKPTEEIIKNFVKNLNVKVEFDGDNQQVIVNNSNYTPRLRDEEVSTFVAFVSPFDEVRQKVRQIQREFAKNYDCIMEGRDIGTSVFPDADVKIYLDATPEERAKRRLKQNLEKGISMTYEEVLKAIIQRDNNDKNRTVDPLRQAEDAIYLDTTELSIDEVVEKVIEIINKKNANS